MPKVKIDGREIEVPKGTTLLQAAEALGLEVPQMCYHPGLSVVGVCRVCLCQVEGWPKMTPACATEATDGMEVGLYDEGSEKARKAVIEFWLLNHPLDCPVCDQGGECPLQDIAFDHGYGTSRLNDPKLKKAKRVDLGEHVILDEERCILCWRCTRFTQEVSQSNQIMLRDRGVYTTVGTPPGVTFDDPFSGNVVDLCPVGALTSKDFRFRSRVWEMASTEGVCTGCAVGCNTYVWSKKGRAERLTARPNLQVNDYWLCDRGRYDLEFVNHPDRLVLPRLRVDGKLVEVEWDVALGALAKGLKPAVGTGKGGALFSRHLANEEYWSFQKFVREGMKSNHLNAGRSEVLTPARAALIGKGRQVFSVTEIDIADTILVVGGDLEKTHPVYSLRIRKAVRENGARLFLAAPEPGRLAEAATESVSVPARELPAWFRNIAEESLGATLKEAKNLVVLVNAGDGNAAMAEGMESFLAAAPSGARWKCLMLDAGGNVAGSMAMGVSPRYLPGMKPLSGEAGMSWSELITAAGAGTISSLLLVNSGRRAEWDFTDEEKASLAKAPFVAAFDLFAEDVETFADLILPAPSFMEVDATFTTPDGLVQLARRNMVPRTPTTLQVLHQVAGELGIALAGPAPIDVFRELAREVPGYAGLDYGKASGEGVRFEAAQMAGAGAE